MKPIEMIIGLIFMILLSIFIIVSLIIDSIHENDKH